MQPEFGTSGLRGLALALTPDVVDRYVRAFVSECPVGSGVYVGADLRVSSPALKQMVCHAITQSGYNAYDCGPCPTPALALAARNRGAAAIMVTGSHIPAERNGLKFYSTLGEITKADESAIVARLGDRANTTGAGRIIVVEDAIPAYLARYTGAFGQSLSGLRIGVFQHSAVGRDDLVTVLQQMGASVVAFGRSDDFVPIDTEALSPDLRRTLRYWAQTEDLDAIVSTDADGDRPLMTDGDGYVVPGDILGQITARALGADHVVTPISTNSSVATLPCFKTVAFTKIGSPYVLQAMATRPGRTVGYEANGGFILGFDARGMAALPTRDALLPILQVLALARAKTVAGCVAEEPARVTRADRLQDINRTAANVMLNRIAEAPVAFFAASNVGLNKLDGLRFTMPNDDILHLRLSGNAPELRVYAESRTPAAADALLSWGMARAAAMLSTVQPAS